MLSYTSFESPAFILACKLKLKTVGLYIYRKASVSIWQAQDTVAYDPQDLKMQRAC